MKAVRGLLLACAAVLLAGAAAFADAKDETKQALLGKWETKQKFGEKEVTITLDFTKDGKLSMMAKVDDMERKQQGTYKVLSDDELEVKMTTPMGDRTDKSKFKVTKDTLEITGRDGKAQKFTKAK